MLARDSSYRFGPEGFRKLFVTDLDRKISYSLFFTDLDRKISYSYSLPVWTEIHFFFAAMDRRSKSVSQPGVGRKRDPEPDAVTAFGR